MADPLPWPDVLVPKSEDWTPRDGSRSGGQTIEGNEQVVVSPTARWKATRTIPCPDAARVRAMRAVIARGRAAMWAVGPCEVNRAPWNVDLVGGKITYGRAVLRPDVYVGDNAPTLAFALAEAADMNATVIKVRRDRGGALEPGMVFSIGNRLHVAVGVDGENGTPGRQGPPETVMTLAIRPWLRADYPAGTALEFGRPLGTMRLASDDTGAMELQLSKFGTVTLDLVEAF